MAALPGLLEMVAFKFMRKTDQIPHLPSGKCVPVHAKATLAGERAEARIRSVVKCRLQRKMQKRRATPKLVMVCVERGF